jgi:ERCC4-type nuclease
MEIIIDNRELKLIERFNQNKNNQTNVQNKQLNLGDIIIKKDDNIILIIERKTIGDLFSSIQDGRYKEQKIRLISNFNSTQILYIIEGSIEEYNNKYYKNFKSIVYGAIINTIFRDKIKILRTNNITDTFNTVNYLYNKINSNIGFFTENKTKKIDNYIETIKLKKKDNLTPLNCNILQLAQIPGVSKNMASSIIKNYSSIANLILQYNSIESKNKEAFLKNISYSTSSEKVRKIGPVISKRIYEYLHNIK